MISMYNIAGMPCHNHGDRHASGCPKMPRSPRQWSWHSAPAGESKCSLASSIESPPGLVGDPWISWGFNPQNGGIMGI